VTGLYYGVSICLVTFASGLSVVTLNVYHRGVRGTGVPRIIKALILGKLARLVFLQFEPRDKHGSSMHHVSLVDNLIYFIKFAEIPGISVEYFRGRPKSKCHPTLRETLSVSVRHLSVLSHV
jgi:hypothetical protein